MIISAALLLLSYVSTYVNPAKAWFMTIFGLLFAPLLLCNFLLFVWAILRKSKAIVIPFLALLPTVFMAGKFFRFTDGGNVDAEGGVKILTYNVGRFALAQNSRFSSWKECADSAMAFMKSRNADIICIQEFYMDNPEKVRSYLSSKMPGYDIKYFVNINKRGCYGNVTLSRYPALTKGKIDFERSANLALYSDYDIGGTTLRVYNCHFQSYNISLTRLASSLESDYRKAMKDTEEKMRKSIVRRPKQVDDVMRNIESCPVEAIVTGDFNDNPMSYTYHRISHDLKDTFVEAGRGFGASYSAFWPMLRIDYVFIPQEWHARAHRTDRATKFSDHYPVVTDLVAEP